MAPPRIFTPSGLLARFFGSAISNAAGYAIGGAVQPTLEPYTQDIANATWKLHSVKPLSPADAAEAVVRDLWDEGRAADEASQTGVDGDRFKVLHGLAGNAPAPEELLQLWNREAITEAQVDLGLRQGRLRPEWYPAVKVLRNVLVPVSDLIRMAVREVFSPDQRRALDLDADYPAALTAKAALLGLSEEDSRNYWAAHWNLPSRIEGATMMFRGELSEAEYAGLLRALDYAPTWRDKLTAIARPIPSLSDMIRFAVREVYDPAQRRALDLDADFPEAFATAAALHGFTDEYARQEWAAHWRLPSPEQAYRMLHRGLITPAQLDSFLKAADFAPTWRDKLASLSHLVPGRVDLRRMLKAGVITEQRVYQGYLDIGYAPGDARTLTDFAVDLAAGGETMKHETKTELRAEYEGGYITEAQYRQALTDLGYSGVVLDHEVAMGDAMRAKATRERIVRLVEKAYVEHDIDAADAQAEMASVHVSQDAAARLIGLWDIERRVTINRLTPAQVKQGFKKGALSRDVAIARLVEAGRPAEDAAVYLDT